MIQVKADVALEIHAETIPTKTLVWILSVDGVASPTLVSPSVGCARTKRTVSMTALATGSPTGLPIANARIRAVTSKTATAVVHLNLPGTNVGGVAHQAAAWQSGTL
uniref:Uncharacterized protein n=1 Tax=Eutreptiella gymnastica TaxID=73025 RepID=A0A7S4FZG9_9EUGL